MTKQWYIESYVEDKSSPEEAASYERFEEAFEAVKAIHAAGRLARFLAPVGVQQDQLDALYRVGLVTRI
jgi:hypothetical protein